MEKALLGLVKLIRSLSACYLLLLDGYIRQML